MSAQDHDWVAVCALDAVPECGTRRLQVGAHVIALLRPQGTQVYALEDRCPHKGGPLSEGIVAGERVTCPLHGQSIALATGEVVAPDTGRVRTFALQVVDGQVLLARAELRALAAQPVAPPGACGGPALAAATTACDARSCAG